MMLVRIEQLVLLVRQWHEIRHRLEVVAQRLQVDGQAHL